MTDFIDILQQRGLIHQATGLGALEAHLNETDKPRAYIGFDLTAPSLHVGSLIQLMVLRHMKAAGVVPIVMLGTGTTRVGDPTGKTSTRPVLSPKEIDQNMVGIISVIDRIVGHVQFITNEWFEDFDFLDFLTTYGRHFSANRILALDAIKTRVDSENGITVQEFLYPMMQAVDFHELATRHGVTIQVGGSDQWGNIVAGVDLVRRMADQRVFGITTPLFTDSAGNKMGKTAGGAIWLDAERTSPLEFFQFWRNIEDAKVEESLLLFTDITSESITHGVSVNGPGINVMKEHLAFEVTKLVHGADIAHKVLEQSREMFSSKSMSGAPEIVVERGLSLAEILVRAGLAASNKDADRKAQGGGVKVNGVKVSDVRQPITEQGFVVSVGKKAATVRFT